MPNIKAGYYTDELAEWNKSINFYIREMDEFEQKLAEVISRNSIIGIAEKVETQQALLNQVSEKFYTIQNAIKQQKAGFKTDSTLLDDTLIDQETERRQNDLRRTMQQTERDYVDIKHNCYNFLSGTLKK